MCRCFLLSGGICWDRDGFFKRRLGVLIRGVKVRDFWGLQDGFGPG